MEDIEKKHIIQCLKSKSDKKKIYHRDVPEVYKNDKDIIEIERKIGMRTIGRRGYDVIADVFFVEENVFEYDKLREKEVPYTELNIFEDFEAYFDYANGDIYENSCYYQLDLSKINMELDEEKLLTNKAFIQETIDDYKSEPSNDEVVQYMVIEKNKPNIKKWIDKFNACDTYEKFNKTVEEYDKSALKNISRINSVFFFWIYVFHDLDDDNRFRVIMQYMSTGKYPELIMIKPLCHVYDPDKVLTHFDYSMGVKQTRDKHKRELREYVELIKTGEYKDKQSLKVYFDDNTHYYCEARTVDNTIHKVRRYFETFDELIKYRNGDLTNADLSNVFNLERDFSEYKTDSTTRLPTDKNKALKYVVRKEYNDGRYYVIQEWYFSDKVLLKKSEHKFDYFFDFVAFLKGDLSDSNLLFCDGLQNLNDISGINFENAILTSSFCNKFGIEYSPYLLKDNKIESFLLTQENEKSTAIILNDSRELIDTNENQFQKHYERIYYVTDIHLMHKLQHYGVKSESDVLYVIHSIVRSIIDESGRTILIGGDVSSDFSIFKIFIKALRNELDRRRRHPKVIFILGNHELWDFSGCSFDEIVKKYKELVNEHGMYLLQNDILYIEHGSACVNQISTSEIIRLDERALREKARKSVIMLFGGSAFSGYDNFFNADNGIYREAMDRIDEINETTKFEKLYNKVSTVFSDKKMIILTHSPMNCWRKETEYNENFIYVSGHTHKNHFYDDGEIRVYADNQIGYQNSSIHMKWFDLDNEYDYFSNYRDGIHQITKEDYQSFYRSKNIKMDFNRNDCIVNMLKKNGFYCFIHESSSGALSILNGGALKKLGKKDIRYYYDNMDAVIANIKQPLNEYTKVQKSIAAELQKIGGSGRIHGCIIDIDWNNHLYVNPVDMKITAYWALDIVYKKVYPDVVSLLEIECPELYSRYLKLLNDNSQCLPAISQRSSADISLLPQEYLDTDIYKVSREVKKMQKLNSNILTTWYEAENDTKMIE